MGWWDGAGVGVGGWGWRNNVPGSDRAKQGQLGSESQ